MSRVFYHSVIHGLGFFICFMIWILHAQNRKTRFFYDLYSDETMALWPIRAHAGSFLLLLLLTNDEASTVYYTVIKHDGLLRARGIVENTSGRRVFSSFLESSQMFGVFYQCHTLSRLHYLLYDITAAWRKEWKIRVIYVVFKLFVELQECLR